MKSGRRADVGVPGFDLRTGLDTAIGVGTPPIAFILAIVGVADDDDKFPTPIRGTPDCCICCSGDNASGV